MDDLREALDIANQRARAIQGPAPERTVTTCRCGDQETAGRETPPPVDLRSEDVMCRTATTLRQCQGCPHAVHVGQMCVTHAPIKPSVHLDYYHASCVLI